jgi:hypothetical protein
MEETIYIQYRQVLGTIFVAISQTRKERCQVNIRNAGLFGDFAPFIMIGWRLDR